MADYLHRAYAELERAAPGAPIDLMAAFGDLIDFKPRRASCVAWPETGGVGGNRSLVIVVAPTVALLSMARLFVCATADRTSAFARVSGRSAAA